MEINTYTTGNAGRHGKTAPVFFEIFGFVIAIISLIISFIPCIGYFALIPSIIGFSLCLVAWILKRKDDQNAGLAIAGTIVGLFAILIAIFQYQKFKQVHDGVKELKNDINEMVLEGLEESMYDSTTYIHNDSTGEEPVWEPIYLD